MLFDRLELLELERDGERVDELDLFEPLERLTAGAFDFARFEPVDRRCDDLTAPPDLDLPELRFTAPLFERDPFVLAGRLFTAPLFERDLVVVRGLYVLSLLRLRGVDFRSTPLLRVLWLRVLVNDFPRELVTRVVLPVRIDDGL